MRTKEVTIEGQVFKIAALTIAQVDDLMSVTPDASDVRAWRDRALNTVFKSMASADASQAGSIDAIRGSLDLPTFNELHAAVLDLSGLRVATPGETAAAPVSTSDLSAAA